VAITRSVSEGTRGGPAYLGKDLLGSVMTSTNDYGSLEDRYEYDAFGKPYTGDLTQGMNLGYTGKPYDSATGLYNYGYRDYKPEAARFTTVDPIRDGANWFVYVNNDPVNWVDLWGLNPSDRGRAVTEAEKRLYEQASGHSINYDNITIYTNERPTTDKVRNSLEGIGIPTGSITKQQIDDYVNHPDMSAIALPDGSIYMYNSNPSTPDVIHEINHQDTYQNGATITIDGVTTRLNTSADVVNQLIKEGELYDQGVNPYRTPGYLEYQAREVEINAERILNGNRP
jgi:RHS repeat-associated protein